MCLASIHNINISTILESIDTFAEDLFKKDDFEISELRRENLELKRRLAQKQETYVSEFLAEKLG